MGRWVVGNGTVGEIRNPRAEGRKKAWNSREGAKAAKAEFAAKVFPIIQEIKSAGVQTLRGICD
jgi:hypothetical protein